MTMQGRIIRYAAFIMNASDTNMTTMKRMKLLLIVLACLITIVPSVTAQQELPDLVVRIKPSVVAVVTYDKGGRRVARGSGFCVAVNRIITNRHVVEDAFRIEVHTTGGREYRVIKIASVDEDGDLALLETESLNAQVKPLTVANFSPREGEKVMVVGNPLGLEGSVSDGIVSAFRNVRGVGKLIQITAPISPGSSGSPVINVSGEVVGVATLNLEGGQNLNFAISSERIVSLWSSLLITSNNPRPSLPVPSAEVQPLTAEQLFSKGAASYESKSYEESVEFLKQAIRLNPKSYLAQHYLGLAFYGLKQYRDAVAAFQAAINLTFDEPVNRKISIYCLGLTYLALGETNAALEQQKLLKDIDPDKAKELLSLLTNISGSWKSSNGDTYKIVDDGNKVLVKLVKVFYNDNYRNVEYEAQWAGDIAIGIIFNDYNKYRFVLKAVDATHIWFRRCGGLNLKDPPEKVLKKANKEIEKEPDEIWTKMRAP
jgi:S1-C subfamily serine protease